MHARHARRIAWRAFALMIQNVLSRENFAFRHCDGDSHERLERVHQSTATKEEPAARLGRLVGVRGMMSSPDALISKVKPIYLQILVEQ